MTAPQPDLTRQKEIDGKSCCPKCDSAKILVAPTGACTANIGWVTCRSDAECQDCKHAFGYVTGHDNSAQFRWSNPNL